MLHNKTLTDKSKKITRLKTIPDERDILRKDAVVFFSDDV